MTTDPRRLWARWIPVAVSLALLAWALSRIELSGLAALLLGADPLLLMAASLLGPFQVLVAAERWRLATLGAGYAMSRRDAVREYALSHLLNQVLPGGVVGDVSRVWRARHQGGEIAVGAALVERGVDLAVHLVFVIAGLVAWTAVHPGHTSPPGALPAAVVLLLLLTALPVLPPRLAPGGDIVRRCLRGGYGAGQAGLSAVLTGSILFGFLLCGEALDLPVRPLVLTAIPLLLLAIRVPVSVGGWGLREATAIVLLPTLGWTEEQALALTATFGLTVMLGALPGAVVIVSPPEDACTE